MAISLEKGGRFNLTKKEPGLQKIMVGLGWEMLTTQQVDADVSVFMLAENGKLPMDENFIFYNNLKAPDGSIQHTGDNRTGVGEGDDEMVLVNLPLVSTEISKILFISSIHDAATKKQNFGMLKEAYIRIVDVVTKREILRYDLGKEFASDTEVEFGNLELINGDWHFTASGQGSRKGLQGYVDIYA